MTSSVPQEFIVRSEQPNANGWLITGSLTIALPAFFFITLSVYFIKRFIKHRCYPQSDRSEQSSPSNAARAQPEGELVIIGADGNEQVVAQGGAGSKPGNAGARVIDLRSLDLEASASMNATNVCNICFAHHVSVRFEPCGHAFTCSTCAQYFAGRPCGLCRQTVTSIIEAPVEDEEEEKEDEDSSSPSKSDANSNAGEEEEDDDDEKSEEEEEMASISISSSSDESES